MIDPYHLVYYDESAVNYNRDIQAFPILKNILTKIMGNDEIYRSPTDMGVNMAGYCITDDELVREAAKQEIVGRYFKTLRNYKEGGTKADAVKKSRR